MDNSTNILQDYSIIDNGGEPFIVTINFAKKKIFVYQIEHYDSGEMERPTETKELIYIAKYIDIFIGRSPLDNQNTIGYRYDGQYEYEFDGNSILIETGENTYTYIGAEIYCFQSFSKINYYLSLVGPSCSPYPYAIDEDNNIYLMIEKISFKYTKDLDVYFRGNGKDSPYVLYYFENIDNLETNEFLEIEEIASTF
jgi:hypothetical protein